MNELNSIESLSNLNAISLSDQTKFRLNEINKIKAYFNSEIQDYFNIFFAYRDNKVTTKLKETRNH